MRVYIAGAMEHSSNWNWWFELRDLFKEHKIEGIVPFDVESVSNHENEYEKVRDNKESLAHKIVCAKIVSNDLQLIESCNAMFVRYTEGCRKGAGTHGEMTVARYLKIPIIVWVDNYDMQEVPSWVYGCTKDITPIKEIAIHKLINIRNFYKENDECDSLKTSI